jgi:hypothetical protein
MQYLLYHVICFKVRGNIREVFMANVVEVTLATQRVFTWQHAQMQRLINIVQEGQWDPIPL